MFSIYVIEHVASARRYVGHSCTIGRRWYQHRFHLERGTHHSQHLQRAWRKYGADAFRFQIVQDGIPDLPAAVAAEQAWIDKFRACESAHGFNRSPSAGSNYGMTYSVESRIRMSQAQQGRTFTAEARQRISEALTGRVQSAATREKRNAKLRGQRRSAEVRRRLAEAQLRRSGTPLLEAFGRKQAINDWAREFGLDFATLRNRLKRGGMTLEQALTVPKHRGARRDLQELVHA